MLDEEVLAEGSAWDGHSEKVVSDECAAICP